MKLMVYEVTSACVGMPEKKAVHSQVSFSALPGQDFENFGSPSVKLTFPHEDHGMKVGDQFELNLTKLSATVCDPINPTDDEILANQGNANPTTGANP